MYVILRTEETVFGSVKFISLLQPQREKMSEMCVHFTYILQDVDIQTSNVKVLLFNCFLEVPSLTPEDSYMLAWVFSNASLDFILLFLSVKPECVHDGPVTLGVVPKRDAEVSFLKKFLRMSKS